MIPICSRIKLERSFSFKLLVLFPNILISPASGFFRSAARYMIVVFPDPEGPFIRFIVSGSSEKVTSISTSFINPPFS